MPRSKEELTKLTVVDLKNALKELGQPLTGKKEELVDRLFAAEESGSTAPAATEEEPVAQPVPAAEAAEPQPAPAAAQAPAAEPPAEEKPAEAPANGKHAKIVFSEDSMKAMPSKITVVHSVELAKTESQKLKERADKFKDPDVEKAKQRAQRFGVFNPDVEKDKAKKRAERFGVPNEDLDEERKAKRAARFGIVDPVAKLASRAERFGHVATVTASGNAPKTLATGNTVAAISSAEFEAQKKARAARFAS